jgi:phage baseplate assembly protein W
MARWFGYNPPFVGGVQGVLSRQEDVRLIKNDLLQLLLTVPGERVHRPNFGTPIRASVFEPFTDELLSSLRSQILNIIESEEPRVSETDVFLEADRDRHILRIKVIAQLTFDPNIKLELETMVSGTGA